MDSQTYGNEDERLNILRMVEDGKLSATEAASLLSKVGQVKEPPLEPPPAESSSATGETPTPPNDSNVRWFRVRVTELASGRPKVTVNLPIGLVNWGMKVGAHYAPEIEGLDFNELSQALQSGSGGKLIDVIDEEDGEHVEIFID